MLSNQVNAYTDSASARVKLRNRIDRLHKQFESFVDIQDELALIDNPEEAERERETTIELFDDAVASATVFLNQLERVDNQANIQPAAMVTNESPAPSAATFSLPVHLPKIDLPKFDGRIEKWVTFKDAFETMIHSQPGLSNVQRLQYLRLSLIGQAESAIDVFTISEDNYEAAWNQLKDIYDNKRVLVLRHATLIRNTPQMTDDSPKAIRDFVNHIQLHIRSLQALCRTWEDIASDLLTSMMIAKMSAEIRRAWERTLTDTAVPKAIDLLKHLRIASHQSKDTETPHYSSDTSHEFVQYSKPRSPPPNRKFLPSRKSPPSLRTSSQPSSSRVSPPSPRKQRYQAYVSFAGSNCKICNSGSHAPYQCQKFLDMPIDDRRKAIQRIRFCLNCLQPDHVADDCKSGGCRVCNGRHNTKLHKDVALQEDKKT
ncbi:uncharacterized protein LOC143265690 [Megachile rotundata]|uniref:uncharacterized protein LOC143265690 n=1 Tax=Megachile rotundata TaxID=143995 RepID=UPI003FD4F7B9